MPAVREQDQKGAQVATGSASGVRNVEDLNAALLARAFKSKSIVVACPSRYCHAKPGEPCWTRAGNPVDSGYSTHVGRWDAWRDAGCP